MNDMDFGPAPRRVVTGHTEEGISVIVSDSPTPVSRLLETIGGGFFEVWQTPSVPAPVRAVEADPTEGEITIPPPPGGVKIRVNEFLPGHLDDRGLQSPMHRTESVDFGIVLEGEVVLVLDREETTLRAGDIVVQRGTNHAWANRSDNPARMMFILVDGRFDESLKRIIPDARLTHAVVDSHGDHASR